MRQEGGQQHRKRFGQHLCNAIYKIQIGKEGGTRPSKQGKFPFIGGINLANLSRHQKSYIGL